MKKKTTKKIPRKKTSIKPIIRVGKIDVDQNQKRMAEKAEQADIDYEYLNETINALEDVKMYDFSGELADKILSAKATDDDVLKEARFRLNKQLNTLSESVENENVDVKYDKHLNKFVPAIKTTTRTSDPEWFENWRPKKSHPITSRAVSQNSDEVLNEMLKIMENQPSDMMESLERDVASKTKEFLFAKRSLLESKKKLSLAYDKFIKTVKLDKDSLTE